MTPFLSGSYILIYYTIESDQSSQIYLPITQKELNQGVLSSRILEIDLDKIGLANMWWSIHCGTAAAVLGEAQFPSIRIFTELWPLSLLT